MILAALSERGTPYPALKQDARGRTVMHYAVGAFKDGNAQRLEAFLLIRTASEKSCLQAKRLLGPQWSWARDTPSQSASSIPGCA